MKDTFTDSAQLQTFLNQLGAGSDQAFNELYATFRIPLYRYAFVQNLSDHDAQAVADDTLIEIAKNPLRVDFGARRGHFSAEFLSHRTDTKQWCHGALAGKFMTQSTTENQLSIGSKLG